jgi:hypothetical protein
MNAENYNELSDKDLYRAYNDLLNEYADLIEKKIPLSNDWIEEIEYLVFERNDIHEVIGILRKRNISFDDFTLVALDKKWQEWALNNTTTGFKLESKRESPESFWWNHIEHLVLIPEQDRDTL